MKKCKTTLDDSVYFLKSHNFIDRYPAVWWQIKGNDTPLYKNQGNNNHKYKSLEVSINMIASLSSLQLSPHTKP